MGIVAAIQTPPVYLDSMACAQRAAERIAEVAEHGAWLAVFPETFIPGDPLYHDYTAPDSEHFKALERRFAEQAITVPGPETECIAAACRAHHMTVAIGVTERPARAGTLYNTLLYFGPATMILRRQRDPEPELGDRRRACPRRRDHPVRRSGYGRDPLRETHVRCGRSLRAQRSLRPHAARRRNPAANRRLLTDDPDERPRVARTAECRRGIERQASLLLPFTFSTHWFFEDGSPEEVVLHDRHMLITVVLCTAIIITVLYILPR